MGLIGDVAKAILILTAVSWVYIIIQFIVMEQYAMALFLLIAFLIPLSMIIYGRRKYGKKVKEATA